MPYLIQRRVRTRQPQTHTRIKPELRISHAWAINTNWEAGIRDSAGTADGVFGIDSGTGNYWVYDDDAYCVLFDNTGHGYDSPLLAIGSASGSALPSSLTWTFEARVWIASLGLYQAIISGPPGGLEIRISSGGVLELLKQQSTYIGGSTSTVTAGKWYSVAVTYDGTTAKFYIDGIPNGSSANAQTFGLGQYYLGAPHAFEFLTNGSRLSRVVFTDYVLSADEVAYRCAHPWSIFEDEEEYLWVPEVSGGSSLAASGTVQVGGSGALSTAVALSGIGATLSSGSAAGQVAVSISAAGLAQAAASAGLSAQVLLAGAASAAAAGNATLATSLNALAAGAAQASGSATINSGAPAGTLQASGQGIASGAAQIRVTVNLSGAGADIASGSAAIIGSPSNNLSASGGAIATTSATGALVVALTAAGFVQAMAAGQLAISVALGAYGAAVASGSATGAGSGITTDAPNGGIPPIILPRSRRAGQVGGVRPANLGGRRL